MSDKFHADILEASAKKAYAAASLDGTAFMNSSEWADLMRLGDMIFGIAASHVSTAGSDDPIIPTIFGYGADGSMAIGAIPDMLSSDVSLRKAIAQSIPSMLGEMKVVTAILIREAWTVQITAPREDRDTIDAAVRDIIPSKDDRRISVVMADLIGKDDQLLVTFRINEKAERSINFEPLNIAIAKHAGKLVQPGMVDMGPRS